MQNKKVVLLIVLGAAAVLSLIYGIVTPSKFRQDFSPPPSPNLPKASEPPVKNVSLSERPFPQSRFAAWGRNPFQLGSTGDSASSKLSLIGIAWDEKSPKAVINDQIVGEGDEIGGARVLKIETNRIILSRGTEEIELKLSQDEKK